MEVFSDDTPVLCILLDRYVGPVLMFAQYNRMNFSVFDSNMVVVRRCLMKILRHHRYNRVVRDMRHSWLRSMLREHKDARELYSEVMC